MKPERWPQIEELYHAALALPREDRAIYLEAAAGEDETLRQEVERLIAADERADEFLIRPAMEVVAKRMAADKKRSLIGQSLGHFSILSLLGAGGMGEVYQTQDTRLERLVALKILPAEVAADRDRMRRFVGEAKAAAALNHPNVATVYEIGEADGFCFIAMEYIEGQTLRQRMTGAAMEVNEALEVAIQTSSALAAAHQAGIVHRDIKPENIMLRQDGYVKVLDFGLAKLTERRPSRASALTDSEPSSEAGSSTPLGVVMGTPFYMSPEQARGEEVDGRSDIFSLGTALYAMIAGRSPFASPTIVETFAAILRHEPPGLATYRPDIPSEFEKIVARALRKRPEERYQTAAELCHDLQSLKQRMASKAPFEQSLPWFHRRKARAAGALRAGWQRQHTIVGLAVLALIFAAATGYPLYNRWSRNQVDSARTEATRKPPAFQTEEPLVPTAGNIVLAAISRDGKYIAYAEELSGKQRLMLKESGTEAPEVLVKAEKVSYDGVTLSPDGQYVYYVQRRENMPTGVLSRAHTVELLKQELPIPGIDSEVTFSPDGKRIAFGREQEGETHLIVANADGSEEKKLATHKLTDYFALKGLAWSPDGKEIACSSVSDENLVTVVVVQVSDGKERGLPAARWKNLKGMAWLADGRGLIVVATTDQASNSQLFYLPYASGEVQQLTTDENEYNGVSLAVTPERLLTTITPTKRYSTIWVGPANGEKDPSPLPMTEPYNDMSWTPDGRIIASQNDKDGLNLMMMDASGENRRQLTSGPGQRYRGRVSSDGRYLVYVSNEKGTVNIWRMDLNDSTTMQLTSGKGEYAPSLTPDGQWVFYWSDAGDPRDSTDKRRVWRVPLGGGEAKPFTQVRSWKPVVSPDGKNVACYYFDKKSNRDKVAVIPISGGQPIWLFEVPEKSIIQWLPDSKALSYCDIGEGALNIWMQPLDSNPPKRLTHFEASSERAKIRFFDWALDGSKQIALLRESPRSFMVLRRD
jgi:eukaryotic-like serine/threonine-protein kinase